MIEYKKLISVTGLPGLYELLASKTDGAVVRSLDDKSTRFVASRTHSFSHLESIEVYTQHDNVNLTEVFQAMEKSSEALPDEKDATAVKAYFAKAYPEMDFERVYASDMKKMIRWFAILQKNEVEIKLSEDEEATEADETSQEEAAAEPVKETVAETAPEAVTEPAKEEPAKKKKAAAKK